MDFRKIKALIDQCKTDDQAAELEYALTDALERTPLAALQKCNGEAYMEGSSQEGETPYVNFELIRSLSNSYATSIRVCVREGDLSLTVQTDQMDDHQGMFSQSWSKALGGEDIDTITAEPNDTINDLAQRAIKRMLAQQTELIERAGVPCQQARELVDRSWQEIAQKSPACEPARPKG